MGRPILSPGKKLTGGKFRPVTPEPFEQFLKMAIFTISTLIAGSRFTGGQNGKTGNQYLEMGGGGVLVTCIYITDHL